MFDNSEPEDLFQPEPKQPTDRSNFSPKLMVSLYHSKQQDSSPVKPLKQTNMQSQLKITQDKYLKRRLIFRANDGSNRMYEMKNNQLVSLEEGLKAK